MVKPLPSALSQADLLRALGEDGFDGQIAASLGWFGGVFWVREDWEASEATGWLDLGGRIQFAAGTPVCRFILEIRWLTEHKLLIF